MHVHHGPFAEREDLGRHWIELEVWRSTERGLQVAEEKSLVFSTIEVGVKQAGPSYIYIACIRRRSLEQEDCASVHLVMTEARFMPA